MDPWSSFGDAELVKQIRAGERGAWRVLTQRHSNRLWSVARGLRLGDADAADAVQTTWLRLVEHLDTLREPEYVGTWLATTMRRECLGALKRRARVTVTESWDDVPDRRDPLDSRLLRDERDTALWEAFRALDDRCRVLLRVLMADPPPPLHRGGRRAADAHRQHRSRPAALPGQAPQGAARGALLVRRATPVGVRRPAMVFEDDDALLDRLRRVAAEADPMPPAVLIAADAAIETRNLDDLLAALVADSRHSATGDAPVLVRAGEPGTDQERLLSYAAAEEVRIDLAVQPEDGAPALIGQLTGAAAEGCRLERPDGTTTPVQTDDLGRFLLTDLAPGLVRLRCRSASGSSVVTEWLTL